MPFYNTIRLTNNELWHAVHQARNQGDKVLTYYQFIQNSMSPSQVHAGMVGLAIVIKNTPLTSIRRAICDLTLDGHLVKTEHLRPGPYGKPEYMWRLARKEDFQYGPI